MMIFDFFEFLNFALANDFAMMRQINVAKQRGFTLISV